MSGVVLDIWLCVKTTESIYVYTMCRDSSSLVLFTTEILNKLTHLVARCNKKAPTSGFIVLFELVCACVGSFIVCLFRFLCRFCLFSFVSISQVIG